MLTEPDEYEVGSDGKQRQVKGLRVTIRRMIKEGGKVIESLVGRFLRDNDEINSIQSTADRQTVWALSEPIRKSMARNDIDFRDLKKRPITVYVILPPERMRTHSVWLRLLVVTALRAHYKAGGLPTLFMLDEFAQLGHLGPVEDALALLRGYKIRLWACLQDLPQLKSIYKSRWESFMGCAGVTQFFAPNDLETAQWISKRAGETTTVAAGYNLGNSDSENKHSANSGMSYQQSKRSALPAERVDGHAPRIGSLLPRREFQPGAVLRAFLLEHPEPQGARKA
ncbi:MAG: type IV secretory system conjugative DNA transfer family protein [Rhizomicrobium sp.]